MIGIDIVEVDRMDTSDKFLSKIAYESEIEYINSFNNQSLKAQKVASLFCVKEAIMKALGLGNKSGVVFKDIKLLHFESGKPYVELYGVAKERFEKDFKSKNIDVSISHVKNVATAIALIHD